MSKEIYLTQGKRAVVDDEDYDRLVEVGTWYAAERKSATTGRHLGFYAARTDYKDGKKTTYMHNVIARRMRITHLNGDMLDNRKQNLSPITSTEIQGARIKQGRYVCSRYKGVRRPGRMKRWQARIAKEGKLVLIGRFDTEEEAARAYDKVAREMFGKYAMLNFPVPGDRYFKGY